MSDKPESVDKNINFYNISELSSINKKLLELFREELQTVTNDKVTTDNAVVFILEDYLKSYYGKLTGIRI